MLRPLSGCNSSKQRNSLLCVLRHILQATELLGRKLVWQLLATSAERAKHHHQRTTMMRKEFPFQLSPPAAPAGSRVVRPQAGVAADRLRHTVAHTQRGRSRPPPWRRHPRLPASTGAAPLSVPLLPPPDSSVRAAVAAPGCSPDHPSHAEGATAGRRATQDVISCHNCVFCTRRGAGAACPTTGTARRGTTCPSSRS